MRAFCLAVMWKAGALVGVMSVSAGIAVSIVVSRAPTSLAGYGNVAVAKAPFISKVFSTAGLYTFPGVAS
jgi:hypothetical protein